MLAGCVSKGDTTIDISGSPDAESSGDAGATEASNDVDTPVEVEVRCSEERCGPDSVPVGGYSMDRTEVTRRQYAAFLQDLGNHSVGALHGPDCTTKSSHIPEGDCAAAAQASGEWNSDEESPVVCVDWCDAWAFCAWAGKRLCGAIGGGSLPFAAFTDPAKSQWFNACSEGGANTFPYGDTYNGEACTCADSCDQQCSPEPANAACSAAGISDLSGNVAEWEDCCGVPAGTTVQCRVRGGGYSDSQAACSCAAAQTRAKLYADAHTGFRCCRD